MYMYTLFYRCKKLEEQLVDMKDAVNATKSVIQQLQKTIENQETTITENNLVMDDL